jgi:hypothetical protein
VQAELDFYTDKKEKKKLVADADNAEKKKK